MPPTPSQIREQLLKAIDQDAKVTNMVGVLEAISCLENTQITKEALEETRLGKIVNDIRKNTVDSSLSTRCKKLVRIWSKQFVRGGAAAPSSTKQPSGSTQDETTNRQPTPPTQGTAQNTSGGIRTPSLKSQTSTTPSSTSMVDKKKSENHKRRKLGNSPGSVSSTGSTPSSAKKARSAVSTPTSNATKDKICLEKKNGMPAQKDASNSNLPSSKSAFSKVKPSAAKSSSRTCSPASKVKGTSSPGLSKPNANTNKALSKSPLTKPVSSAVNSSSSKVSPSVLFPKPGKSSPSVKQSSYSNSIDSSRLEADIIGKDEEGTKDRSTSSRLQNKSPSVQKSLLDSNSSSATVKLRSPPACITEQPTTLINASTPAIKYDYIQEVSQSMETDSSTQGPSKTSFSIFDDDYEEEGDIHSDEKYSKTLTDFDKEPALSNLTFSADSEKPSGGSLFDIASIEINDENDGVVVKDTIDVPLEPDAIQSDDGKECEEEQEPSQPVTEEDIHRIHEQEWDGVNGCYNNQREWFDWTQSLSVTTQDDEALHILPYICID